MKKRDDRITKFVEASAETEAVRFTEAVYDLFQYCESPIEELLVAALYEWSRIGGETDLIFMQDCTPSDKNIKGETAYIYQQAKVGNYRADFLILDASVPLDVAPPRWMVVECDGHDFHERTKEQARRDKRRDRFFQSKGYKVLRFTGSEIWASPEDVAGEIINELARDDGWRNRER